MNRSDPTLNELNSLIQEVTALQSLDKLKQWLEEPVIFRRLRPTAVLGGGDLKLTSQGIEGTAVRSLLKAEKTDAIRWERLKRIDYTLSRPTPMHFGLVGWLINGVLVNAVNPGPKLLFFQTNYGDRRLECNVEALDLRDKHVQLMQACVKASNRIVISSQKANVQTTTFPRLNV